MSAPLGRILLAGAAATAAAGVVLSACQSYEAEVVLPVAIKSVNQQFVIAGEFVKPKVMIAVDRSGSMMDSVDGTGGACALGATYDPSKEGCKWKDLLKAFAGTDGLLPTTRDTAFFGLTVFPGTPSDACSAGQTVVPISDTSDNVDAITNQLNTITPGGGTPIATTLQNLLDDPQLQASSANQPRVVMLLTDGLPNCNAANRSLCEECKVGCGSDNTCRQCESESGSCKATFTVFTNSDCVAQNPCLDGDKTVKAVEALRAKDITTFIIGFGKVTAGGSAASILDDAAIAGGSPRDASFPTRFYQANSSGELKKALEDFVRKYIPTCSWTLDPPPKDDQLVQVVKKDAEANTAAVLTRDADYTLTGDVVELKDALCAEVKSAPPNRYTYEFRYVAPF